MTPPYALLLAEIPAQVMEELVATLLSREVPVPSVSGDTETIETFATAWRAHVPIQTSTTMRQRLYRLAVLQPPTPPPPEDALAGAQQVRNLVRAATLVDDDAVAEQRGRREITRAVGA
jgi:hypothetical protein